MKERRDCHFSGRWQPPDFPEHASAGFGAAAVQTLHAQTKPPAYNIAEIAIKDQDGYNKEYLPLITKALTDAGGKFVVRGGKTISFEGAPPRPASL